MTNKTSNKMWGGRFASGPAAIMEEINASIDFDQRLYAEDISGSLAHAQMLAAQGHHLRGRRSAIAAAWNRSRPRSRTGSFAFSRALEDIHMNVEARLTELIGPAAGRLHTARSRNDQVATDFRLWVRDDSSRSTRRAAAGLQRALCAPRPRRMPRPSCRASPICRRRSR